MGESFPKAMHMLTMIINEQTMPYYLSDELAPKPYNHKIINNAVDKIECVYVYERYHNYLGYN
jgi:hypothetical protein